MNNIKKGTVCRHHSGRVYTVLEIANTEHSSEKFPKMVVYMGANGNIWTRKESEFSKKFTVLFDGTQLENKDNS